MGLDHGSARRKAACWAAERRFDERRARGSEGVSPDRQRERRRGDDVPTLDDHGTGLRVDAHGGARGRGSWVEHIAASVFHVKHGRAVAHAAAQHSHIDWAPIGAGAARSTAMIGSTILLDAELSGPKGGPWGAAVSWRGEPASASDTRAASAGQPHLEPQSWALSGTVLRPRLVWEAAQMRACGQRMGGTRGALRPLVRGLGRRRSRYHSPIASSGQSAAHDLAASHTARSPPARPSRMAPAGDSAAWHRQ